MTEFKDFKNESSAKFSRMCNIVILLLLVEKEIEDCMQEWRFTVRD